eukprot:gene12075-16212_t
MPWPSHALLECEGVRAERNRLGQVAEAWAKKGHGELLEWLLGGSPSKKHLVAALTGIVTSLNVRASSRVQIALAADIARAAADCLDAYRYKCKGCEYLFEPGHAEFHEHAKGMATKFNTKGKATAKERFKKRADEAAERRAA